MESPVLPAQAFVEPLLGPAAVAYSAGSLRGTLQRCAVLLVVLGAPATYELVRLRCRTDVAAFFDAGLWFGVKVVLSAFAVPELVLGSALLLTYAAESGIICCEVPCCVFSVMHLSSLGPAPATAKTLLRAAHRQDKDRVKRGCSPKRRLQGCRAAGRSSWFSYPGAPPSCGIHR